MNTTEFTKVMLNRLFFYPSYELYNTPAGFYDFGPIGSIVKKKYIDYARRFFITSNGFLEIDGSIITPKDVLIASGHEQRFRDPITICKQCKSVFRADKLINNEQMNIEELKTYYKTHEVLCPVCKTRLIDVELFNPMFKTEIGYNKEQAYLRPETAQAIYVSFPRIFRSIGGKLPLVISQIGKSFRNEVSPRKGIIRLREFNQIEIEYFFNPDDKNEIELDNKKIKMNVDDKIEYYSIEDFKHTFVKYDAMAFFLIKEWEFFKSLGIKEEEMWFRWIDEKERPHYSKGNIDLEVKTSYGIIEITGNAYRTDYDLKNHARKTGKKTSVKIDGKEIYPHVIEASIGVERSLYAVLEHNFIIDKERGWNWFKFPSIIAPYTLAIFPLVKRDGLDNIARNIFKSLIRQEDVYYKDTGSIGKRYARADEIGIPYCITIDYQTKEDNTVTIRYRDSTKQERIDLNNILIHIRKYERNQKHKD